MTAITTTLEACATYFEARAAADFEGNGIVHPNQEMNLLIMVRAALVAMRDDRITPQSVRDYFENQEF